MPETAANSTHKLPLLLEPQELFQFIEQADNKVSHLVIDLSRDSVYQQAHIPGAIFLDFKSLISGEQPASGKLPNEERLSQLFSQLGLEDDTHVICYDDEGGGWAGRLIWTLDCIGHKHYSYVNGGIHAWLADGLPVSQQATQAKPTNYTANINNSVRVDAKFILDNLDNDDVQIWDARSEAEYLGHKSFAAKVGHIPGAFHFEWTSGMDKDNALKLLPLATLQSTLDNIGLRKEATVITHCQTHHRSGFTFLLGKILGYNNIKAYDGSWSEWGNLENTPVETQAN